LAEKISFPRVHDHLIEVPKEAQTKPTHVSTKIYNKYKRNFTYIISTRLRRRKKIIVFYSSSVDFSSMRLYLLLSS